MTSIGEILQPEHVNLALAAKTKPEAINEVLAQLNGDPRIKDWEALRAVVLQRNAPSVAAGDVGICIAHGRTEAVHALVLAAGRFVEGVACCEITEPVKLVFVAGIPAAFDADYLRIVGAIVRMCRDKHQLDRLLAAKTAQRFVELLSAGEAKL